jgi:signal transduction histidine kinase
MKNLKIASKIGIIFLLIFITFLVLALNGANTSNDIFNTMSNFYEHPYTVTNAAKDIKINMLSIHKLLDEIIIDGNRSNIMQKNLLIIEYEQNTLDKIRLIEKRFLGDKEKVINLRKGFNESITVHHDIIDTIMLGDIDGAKEINETIGVDNSKITDDLIDELLLVAGYIADDYIEQSIDSYNDQMQNILIFGIFSFVVLLTAAWILSRSVRLPMSNLVTAIEESKDPEAMITIDTDRKDEIGEVSAAFVEMLEHARKQQKIEIELLHENFRKLFSSIHLGAALNSLVRDDNGNIIDYIIIEENTSFKIMIDTIRSKKDVTYRDSFLDIIKIANNKNKSFSVELNIESTGMYLYITAFPLQKDQVVMLFEDITEKVQFEQKRIESDIIQRNQQKLESIGTLAGGVAHEINNPINGIMNYGQLIADFSDENTKTHEYAQEIINESNRISTIVSDLLQFSRHESKEYEAVGIDALLAQTLSLIKTIIKHDQIELTVNIEENCPPVKCRLQQIQQVILNLLTNARSTLNEKYPQYNENKIIKVECCTVEIEKYKWFRLIVEDHGNGIDESVMEKIFDPFFSTKGRNEGTGLGLSISHNIVEEHNGKLYCETEKGEYTKFYLELPYDNS